MPQHAVFKSRVALLKRLADVVSLPGSRVNAFERALRGRGRALEGGQAFIDLGRCRVRCMWVIQRPTLR